MPRASTLKTFLIGGARSGKSSLATRWSLSRANEVCCIVTATVSDAEMASRIAAHRSQRPAHWRVREEPVHLGAAIRTEAAAGTLLLVDCLTLWSANCLWPPVPLAGPSTGLSAQPCAGPSASSAGRSAQSSTGPSASSAGTASPDLAGWRLERQDLADALRDYRGEIILVSNEVGMGIVPENAAARLFRDEQGSLNQAIAALCDEVFLVAAGLPLALKECG